MHRRFLLAIVVWMVCSPCSQAWAAGQVFTLWPLLDYRAAEDGQYRSLHLFGPLLKHETSGGETEYALRPLFYRAEDQTGESLTEVFYPVAGRRNYGETAATQVLQLFTLDTGGRETYHHRKFYLFPFLFYGEHEERGRYAAFFPFGGTLYGWFNRDEITFSQFPLYSHTERGGTRVDNFLWPFFARISGPGESGFKVWPLYGSSRKIGAYQKRFFLWPLGFAETTGLESGEPTETRAFLPFYYRRTEPESEFRSVLWPFFNYKIDHERNYRRWDAFWPLIRVTRGPTYHGNRFLPFFADETMDYRRKRWYLWPFYRLDEMHTELLDSREHRVVYFLLRDFHEYQYETGRNKRRVLAWPLFGYTREDGVRHFHALALLEPFLPGNEGIERSWAPLWRIYQQKWDSQGNQVASLLWNLFWLEKRGSQVAWELFPLIDYRQPGPERLDLRLLKGLLRYRSGPESRKLNLFFLPWAIEWAPGTASGA